MKKITFVNDKRQGWQGIYFGDKLMIQSSDLYPVDVFEALGIKFDYVDDIGDYLTENNTLPASLKELKQCGKSL